MDPDPRRLQLNELLLSILGNPNVYFQPPENINMQYPCIRYIRDDADTKFANNHPYRITKRYQLTIIDRNPDSDIPDKVALLPTAVFDRHYTADNLNHDVYTIFF